MANRKIGTPKQLLATQKQTEATDTPTGSEPSPPPPSSPQPTPNSHSEPPFLSNFVASVDAFRASTPLIVNLTGLLAENAHENYKDTVPKSESILRSDSNQSLPIDLSPQQQYDILNYIREASTFSRTSRGIPSLMLTAIIAETELLISEMCKWVFHRQPNKIRIIKKSLEIADLQEVQSLDELKSLFIDKEIDELLRKSPIEQIENLQKLLDVDVIQSIEDLPVFLEIFERRNVMMHAGGRVSRQYINALKKIKYPKDKVPSINELLTIDSEYFSSSTRILQNFFSIFGFRVWHKFTKGPHKEQDKWLLGYIFDRISSRRYKDALQFLRMAEILEYHFEDKVVENMIIINKAQCLKWLGDEDACLGLLSETDWTAHADNFVLCVRVLRNEFDEAVEIVERIGTTGVIKFDDYCIWPVFRKAREHSGFCDAVARVFGRELVAVLPTTRKKVNNSRKSPSKSTARKAKARTLNKETRH